MYRVRCHAVTCGCFEYACDSIPDTQSMQEWFTHCYPHFIYNCIGYPVYLLVAYLNVRTLVVTYEG